MNELYKDPLVKIQLNEKPCALGHLEVLPVRDVKKIGDLTDSEIKHLFFAGSYSATALFEYLGAHGTNLVFTELPNKPFAMEIISRKENDGIDLLWTPNKGNPEELKDVAKQIKDAVDEIKWQEENPDKVSKTEIKEVKKEIVAEEGKRNFLLESLYKKP